MCVVRRNVEPLHVVGVPGYELQPDELGGGDGMVRQSPGQPHHRTALQELQHQAHRCHRQAQCVVFGVRLNVLIWAQVGSV